MAQNWWLDQIGRYPLLTPSQEIELGNAIQAWLHHPAGPDGAPLAVQRRGRRAKDRFVNCNLRLAASYVSKHCHRIVKQQGIDDLIQSANEGLIRAVERFDPTRGYRFSTYAFWWIRQSVSRWLELHGRTIAIPGSHSKHLGRLDAVARRLASELGRDPLPHEIAEGLGVSEAVFQQLLINAQPISSLDVVISDDGRDLTSIIGVHDTAMMQLEREDDRSQQAAKLRTLIQKLPDRDQQILTMAWGLDGIETPRDVIADEMGMNERELESHLQLLEQQLAGRAVQPQLIHPVQTPEITAVPISIKRRKRQAISDDVEQLALAI
jgi:RNA polymerase primary sigma factor